MGSNNSYDEREELKNDYFRVLERNQKLEEIVKSTEKEQIKRKELELENEEMNHQLETLKTERDEEHQLRERILALAEENISLKKDLETLKLDQIQLEKTNQHIRNKMKSYGEIMSKHSRTNSAIEAEEELFKLEERLKEVEEEKMNLERRYESKLNLLRNEVSTKQDSKSQIFNSIFKKIQSKNPSIQVVKEHKSITLLEKDKQILKLDLEESFEANSEGVDQNVSVLDDNCTLGDLLEEEQEEHRFVRLKTFHAKSTKTFNTPTKSSPLKEISRHRLFTASAKKTVNFNIGSEKVRVQEIELINESNEHRINSTVSAYRYKYSCEKTCNNRTSSVSFSYICQQVKEVEERNDSCANCNLF